MEHFNAPKLHAYLSDCRFQFGAGKRRGDLESTITWQRHIKDEEHFDFNDAVKLYEKAARLGDAGSMNELGWIYFGVYNILLEDKRKAAP